MEKFLVHICFYNFFALRYRNPIQNENFWWIFVNFVTLKLHKSVTLHTKTIFWLSRTEGPINGVIFLIFMKSVTLNSIKSVTVIKKTDPDQEFISLFALRSLLQIIHYNGSKMLYQQRIFLHCHSFLCNSDLRACFWKE